MQGENDGRGVLPSHFSGECGPDTAIPPVNFQSTGMISSASIGWAVRSVARRMDAAVMELLLFNRH